MGTGLSQEEKVFVQGPGHFGDLVVGALEREQAEQLRELEGGGDAGEVVDEADSSYFAQATKAVSSPQAGFYLNSKEWQLVTALCEKDDACTPELLLPLLTVVVGAAASATTATTSGQPSATSAMLAMVVHLYLKHRQSGNRTEAKTADAFFGEIVRASAKTVLATFGDSLRDASGGTATGGRRARVNRSPNQKDANRDMLAAFVGLLEHIVQAEGEASCVSIQPLQDLGVFNRPVLCILMGYICAHLQLGCLLCVSEGGDGKKAACDSEVSLKLHWEAALETMKDAVAAPLTFVPAFYCPLVDAVNKLLLDADLGVVGPHQDKTANLIWHQPATAETPSADTAPTWDTLRQDFIGQKHVISELEELHVSKERGLVDDSKPTVLVFFGPSGHGKSELGKHLAKLIRASVLKGAASSSRDDLEASGFLSVLHMPNFCTKDSIYSLVDPPTAHVGEGILLSAIRKQSHLVVILDEFEKSTSDAVQNVWLSAFQKKGMLRSLKESSRSASTEKVTFILTCNIADKLIGETDRAAYLAAGPGGQREFQRRWTKSCSEQLRAKFGDPLVNRIDKLLPFAPYSPAESEAFVKIQLCSLSRRQFELGRRLAFTPSLCRYLSTNVLQTFHNPTPVMDALRPILLEATKSAPSSPKAGLLTISVVHANSSLSGAWSLCLHSVTVEAPGASPEDDVVVHEVVAPAQEAPVPREKKQSVAPPTAGGGGRSGGADTKDGNVQMELELETERETHKERAVEQELDLSTVKEIVLLKRELKTTKEKLLEAEKEIETLKERVVQLEYLTGTLLLCLLMSLYMISFVVSMQVLFGLVTLCLGAMYMLVKNFWVLLAGAVRGILRIMRSPYGALVVAALCFLIYQRSGLMASGAPPCKPGMGMVEDILPPAGKVIPQGDL